VVAGAVDMADGDVARVAAGYDLVFEALPRSPTLARLWRDHAMGADFPDGFEHISFVTLGEIGAMRDALALPHDGTLVDLACGMGGPGLWVARESGARLVGIDISASGLAGARGRAARVAMGDRARFVQATFARTGLDAGSADGVMTIDALQYAPDKRAALLEVARILRPGGRFAFACFELDAKRVVGLPVLGTDPVDDYCRLLSECGFGVIDYDETPGWRERLTSAYQAIIDAKEALTAEMGEAAYAALSSEVALTLAVQPYRSRVMVACVRE